MSPEDDTVDSRPAAPTRVINVSPKGEGQWQRHKPRRKSDATLYRGHPQPPFDGDDVQPTLLASALVLASERTLFSALQMAWTVAMIGMGLMMTGANDSLPDDLGYTFIICGVVLMASTWVVHVVRMWMWDHGTEVNAVSSAAWTFFFCASLIVAIICELHFAWVYPYLARTHSVTVQSR